ncbi:Ubiquitin domain-containing protein DSK2b [Forsythia ovata]|uniref:Ubiquitin domain-containing protein DSK2b n=1 Tax=Forsythia ovata TaxID=205694 RepID=A0ABD1TAQ0_9LAMI
MGADGDSSMTMCGDEEVNVNIRCSNGSNFSVRTSLESTMENFKALLAQSCDLWFASRSHSSYGAWFCSSCVTALGWCYSAKNANNSSVAQGANPIVGGVGNAGLGASLFPGLGLGALGGTGSSGLFGA